MRQVHPVPALPESSSDAPRGVVLMLHGGADRSPKPVDDSSLSWRRLERMRRAIEPTLAARGLTTLLLRYQVKGWNDDGRSPAPVRDALAALEELDRRHPGVPVLLLGHSMGGRVAAAVSVHPSVVGVVALAPWLPPGEPLGGVPGTVLRAAHGRADHITSPRATAHFVARAREAGGDATLTDMGRVGHYMLRGERRWNAFATEQSLTLLAPHLSRTVR